MDAAIVNAHILETHSSNHKARSLKQFRAALAKEYIRLFSFCHKDDDLVSTFSTEGSLYHWPSDH